jgi:hypothetical protein
MLEYGEGYLYNNRLWLKRFRLKCQITDNIAVYRLAVQMAEELEDEE